MMDREMTEDFARIQGGTQAEAFSSGLSAVGMLIATSVDAMRQLGHDT